MLASTKISNPTNSANRPIEILLAIQGPWVEATAQEMVKPPSTLLEALISAGIWLVPWGSVWPDRYAGSQGSKKITPNTTTHSQLTLKNIVFRSTYCRFYNTHKTYHKTHGIYLPTTHYTPIAYAGIGQHFGYLLDIPITSHYCI